MKIITYPADVIFTKEMAENFARQIYPALKQYIAEQRANHVDEYKEWLEKEDKNDS